MPTIVSYPSFIGIAQARCSGDQQNCSAFIEFAETCKSLASASTSSGFVVCPHSSINLRQLIIGVSGCSCLLGNFRSGLSWSG